MILSAAQIDQLIRQDFVDPPLGKWSGYRVQIGQAQASVAPAANSNLIKNLWNRIIAYIHSTPTLRAADGLIRGVEQFSKALGNLLGALMPDSQKAVDIAQVRHRLQVLPSSAGSAVAQGADYDNLFQARLQKHVARLDDRQLRALCEGRDSAIKTLERQYEKLESRWFSKRERKIVGFGLMSLRSMVDVLVDEAAERDRAVKSIDSPSQVRAVATITSNHRSEARQATGSASSPARSGSRKPANSTVFGKLLRGNYEYDDQDIEQLTTIYQDQLNRANAFLPVCFGQLISTAWQPDLQQEIVSAAIQRMASSAGIHGVAIPYHIQGEKGDHWTGLLLWVNPTAKKIEARFFDPAGDEKRGWISTIAHNRNGVANARAVLDAVAANLGYTSVLSVEPSPYRQTDTESCGPCVMESFLVLGGASPAPVEPVQKRGALTLRHKQASVLAGAPSWPLDDDATVPISLIQLNRASRQFRSV